MQTASRQVAWHSVKVDSNGRPRTNSGSYDARYPAVHLIDQPGDWIVAHPGALTIELVPDLLDGVRR